METFIIISNGKQRTLTKEEIEILRELVTIGFDSMCDDFDEDEDLKYRSVADLF